MKDLKIWISVAIVVIGAIVAQVRNDQKQTDKLETIEQILLKQEERNAKMDTFLLEYAKENSADNVRMDTVLQFIQQQIEINRGE